MLLNRYRWRSPKYLEVGTVSNRRKILKRKLINLVVVLGIVVVPGLASADGQSARTVKGHYNTLYISPGSENNLSGRFSNGVKFKPRAGERFVSVVVKDDSGFPVRAVVGQDLDGDNRDDIRTEICERTKEPVKLRKGANVIVWAQEGDCNGQLGLATYGTVTATFTR